MSLKKNELKPLQVAERFRGKPRQRPVLAALDHCLEKQKYFGKFMRVKL